MSSEEQNNSKVKVEAQKFEEPASAFDSNILQTLHYVDSSLMMLGMLAETKILLPVISEQHDIDEDFNWFASGQVEIESYRGKYIAIWRKQIVGSGDTAVEAERIARAYFGKDCRPAIVYVPEDDDAML